MGKPADVLLQVKPADYEGRTITVHITTVKRFQGPKGGTDKHRPPRDPVGEEDGDELAEELGRPPRTMEPPDAIHIPIQVPDSEPEMMQDIIRPKPKPMDSDIPTVQRPQLVNQGNQTPHPIIKHDKRRRTTLTSDSDDQSSTVKPRPSR